MDEVSSYYRPRGPLRESRGIALLFSLNLGTLDGGGWSTPRPGRLYPGKDPVPIVQESGWASEPVWIGAENLALLDEVIYCISISGNYRLYTVNA